MQKPDLSFIVPVYNMASTLPAALDSLLQITAPENFEIVLIDDGSTDDIGSVAVDYIAKTEKREGVSFRVISVDNSGRGAARNLGVKKASGEYISFLDADDTIDPDEFMKLWSCAQREENRRDIIIGQFRIVGEDGKIYSKRRLSLTTTPQQLLRKIALSPFSPIHMNAMLIRRTLFERIHEFDIQNINAEDKDVTIQLLRAAGDVTICQSFHYLYHKHRVGRLTTAKKRLMWLWFRQKTIIKNYSAGIRPLSMILQFNYDVVKLFYELVLGYRGKRG